VGAATRLMDRVLGTSLDGKTLSEDHPDAYNQSIEALGFKFACWFEPVKQNQTRGRTEMVGTWLRYSRTYNFEEAFDIKRREIATNARNFTYLLLATLDSLATHCRGLNTKCGSNRYKVMHVAVTPVHPKDWFNWPHGADPVQAYFEEDSITHFWRCLREIKDAPDNKDVMNLRRYILSANDNDAQTAAKQKLRRRLKTPQKIKETLSEAWILPVSCPVEAINNPAVQATAKDALWAYYQGIITRAGYVAKDVNVIPLVCKQWDDTDVGLKNSLGSLKNIPPNEIVGLSASCKQLHEGEIRKLKDEMETATSGFSTRVKEVWKECDKDCDQLLSGSCASLHQLIINCHKLDVRLCEHTIDKEIYPVQEKLRALVAAVLRFDDCLHYEQAWPGQLPKLGEVFVSWLHHSQDDLKLVKLDADDVEKWFEQGLRNEFHLFGLEDTQQRSTEWRILVAADINEPFQVAKVLLLEEDAQRRQECGKNLAGFQDYKELVERLLKGNGPFNDQPGKIETAWIKP